MKITLLCVTLGLIGCKKDEEKPAPAPTPAPTPTPTPPPAPAKPAAPIIVRGAGLATPESVLYDAGSDRYLVANVQGEAGGVDDNGFITVIKPDGTVETLKWIDGAGPGVTLDAPKGMAISGGVLWVADITKVRKFDAKTGVPLGEVKVDGATFLNDVTPDGADGIYVTDTGLDAKFQPTGTDAVYRIGKDGKVAPVMKSVELGGPNGVLALGDAVWVVAGSGEIYRIADGKRADVSKLPKGQLDGIAALADGDFLVSSWEGSAVYRGKPGGTWAEVLTGIAAPADLGYDQTRKAMLIPKFQDHEVVIQPLP